MSVPVFRYSAFISTFSLGSPGPDLAAITGGGTPSSAAWPAANDALFVPIYLEQHTTVTRLYVINGATASGNIDVGIYTADGALITSSGSTAQSGTNAPQFLNITDILLPPGAYYLAAAYDGTGGTIFRANLSVIRNQEAGVVKSAAAFPLPSSASFTTVTSGLYPLMGMETAPGTLY
jgi:hypothetical protein